MTRNFRDNQTIMWCIRLKCDWSRRWKYNCNRKIMDSVILQHQKITFANLIWHRQIRDNEYYYWTPYYKTTEKHDSVRNNHTNLTCFTTMYKYIIWSTHERNTFWRNFHLRIFFRTGAIKTQTLFTNMNQNGINAPKNTTYPPTILEKKSNEYLLRTFDLNNISAWLQSCTSAPIPPLNLIT